MEHTKKFVLMDPRFVRPSMTDKVLSSLDSNISDILNSDVSDEVKAKNYVSALARFKNISAPPKPEEKPIALPAIPPPPPPSAPVSIKKTPRKRTKPVEKLLQADSPLWERTRRARTKKIFGSQWLEYKDSPKKLKDSQTWLKY